MAKSAILLAGLMLGAVPGAHALSEWWTPQGKQCPVFDSEEACEQWCATHRQECGGSTQCSFSTGPQRPACALPVPGWE